MKKKAVFIFIAVLAASIVSFTAFFTPSSFSRANAISVPDDYYTQWFDSDSFLDYSSVLQLIKKNITDNSAADKYKENPIVVAVLDSGIDKTHKAFDGILFNNTAEIAGNGLDDDGNGFIDDVCGWDFVNGDNNPADDMAESHGTHVAGIIAKEIVNYGLSEYIKILPIKAGNANGVFSCGSSNYYDSYWVTEAIKYAVAMGADVINMSFTNLFSASSWGNASYLDNAVQAAYNSGVVLCAAAGNTTQKNISMSSKTSPAALDNVIGVMNLDVDGTVAESSVRGNYYDVIAPGVNVMSAVRQGYSGSKATYCDSDGNKYSLKTGTSMATPVVSFMAAVLMISYDCNVNPHLAASAVNYMFMHFAQKRVDNSYNVASLKYYMENKPVTGISISTQNDTNQSIADAPSLKFDLVAKDYLTNEIFTPSGSLEEQIVWYVKACDEKGNDVANTVPQVVYGTSSINFTPAAAGRYYVYARLKGYDSFSEKIYFNINYLPVENATLAVIGADKSLRAGDSTVFNVANLAKINPSITVYWAIYKDGKYLKTVSGDEMVFSPTEKGEYKIVCKLSTGETVGEIKQTVKTSKKTAAAIGAGVGGGAALIICAGTILFFFIKRKIA